MGVAITQFTSVSISSPAQGRCGAARHNQEKERCHWLRPPDNGEGDAQRPGSLCLRPRDPTCPLSHCPAEQSSSCFPNTPERSPASLGLQGDLSPSLPFSPPDASLHSPRGGPSSQPRWDPSPQGLPTSRPKVLTVFSSLFQALVTTWGDAPCSPPLPLEHLWPCPHSTRQAARAGAPNNPGSVSRFPIPGHRDCCLPPGLSFDKHKIKYFSWVSFKYAQLNH